MIMTDNQRFMRMAIAKAEEADQPFGALIVKGGKVIAAVGNTVKSERNPLAHAEINAIQLALRELGTKNLESCTIYSTVEPCPMCAGAIIWSGIDKLVYGAGIGEIEQYVPQIKLGAREIASYSPQKIEVVGGILSELCVAVFAERRRLREAGK